jgi:ribosomal protein L7Ae-like RNA K-turn-binding protein
LKEIKKNLDAQKLNMVILATDIEQVEGEDGLDEYLLQIVRKCRAFGIPLIFCMGRRQLGALTKFKGSLASIVGIFNY